jgi:hypothetical protein
VSKETAQIDTTKRKRGSKYTLAQKAEVVAIASTSKSLREASRDIGLPDMTIARWSEEAKTNPELDAVVAEKKEEIGVKLERIIDKVLSGIESDALNATLANATSFGILFDKLQLVKGQATNITKTLSDDEEKAKADALALFEEYKKAFHGDEKAALARLSENAPSLASHLVM